MKLLASLPWLPIAPLAFGVLHLGTIEGWAALALVVALLGGIAGWWARPSPTRRGIAIAAGALYALGAAGLVALDPLPGPGTRSAAAPRDVPPLPPAPGPDFVPHPYPTLHVIPTGEVRSAVGWRTASGATGLESLRGLLHVIDHPSYGLVVYETSSAASIDGSALLDAAGLDPAGVRTVIAADLSEGPGIAARSFPAAWLLADARAVKAGGPDAARIQPVRFAENPPFGPFPHYYDLAGDGSILLVSAPGPSPGHTALFLRLRDEAALLAGDVAPVAANLRSRSTPLPPRGAWTRSLGAVLWTGEEVRGVVTVPGWDPSPLVGLDRGDVTLHAGPR